MAQPVEHAISGDEAAPKVIERFLTDEQVQIFMEQGVLVVPNVLTPEEVAEARRGLHGELAKSGVVRSARLEQSMQASMIV
jgi:hypothetical protein